MSRRRLQAFHSLGLVLLTGTSEKGVKKSKKRLIKQALRKEFSGISSLLSGLRRYLPVEFHLSLHKDPAQVGTSHYHRLSCIWLNSGKLRVLSRPG